jgi:uncharacterized protein involved in type VI secretion and phage assembly
MSSGAPLYGKYRGVVRNNVDPLGIGRLLVSVPDVTGPMPSSWAMPCLPLAGINCGLFTVPAINAGVWVEFEHGDPDHPIWVGAYWGSRAEVPKAARTVQPPIPGLAIQTPGLNSLVISDLPGPLGGILIKNKAGAKIAINELGITIDNGLGAKIQLLGPKVSVNGTALTVI